MVIVLLHGSIDVVRSQTEKMEPGRQPVAYVIESETLFLLALRAHWLSLRHLYFDGKLCCIEHAVHRIQGTYFTLISQ